LRHSCVCVRSVTSSAWRLFGPHANHCEPLQTSALAIVHKEHVADMSQQADYLPPPPPHTPSYQAPQTSPLRRLAVQPPRLRTALTPQQGPHGQLHTPASAPNLHLGVPHSPYVSSSPSPYAPSPHPPASPMAMRHTSAPYNPQQWSRTGAAGGQYAPHPAAQTATRPQDVTGMEG
jgi:hypothetical protein